MFALLTIGKRALQDTPDGKRKRGKGAVVESAENSEIRDGEGAKNVSYSSTVLNQVIQLCELGMNALDDGSGSGPISSLVSEIVCLLVSIARLCGKRFKSTLVRHGAFKQVQSIVYRLWTHRCHPSLQSVREQAGYIGSEIS